MPKSGNFSPAFLGSLTPAATKYREAVDDIIKSNLISEEDLSKVTVYLLCIFENSKSALKYHFSLADLKNNYTVGTKYRDITDKSWLN